VDIRWLALDRIGPDAWPKLERMLDDEERERAGRFRFERDRDAYLAAHALARGMLSGFVSRHPSAWRFAVNDHGKPELVPDAGTPPIRFNISHTRGLVAVAVTIENDVGLDVETLEGGRLGLDLASRFFATPEVEYLRALPAERLQEALFAFWTLKEAYIKAVGRGLSVPLDAFCFALDPLAISFSSRQPDNPANWLFRRFTPSPVHAMALALRHAEPHRVRVNAHPAPLDALLAQSDQADGPGKISRR
jgi:4'-phosphopantetheinyl transferase